MYLKCINHYNMTYIMNIDIDKYIFVDALSCESLIKTENKANTV